MAYIGSSPTKVVSRQSANIFTYTATANQTAFTGADANGNTLACTPSDIMVHMNGLRLEESDYTASTTTVTLGSGAAAGDEVTITAFVTFETADAYTKSAADTRYVNVTGDTMSGNLGVKATLKTTHADADVVQFGGTGYLANWENAETYLAENLYVNSSGAYKYLTTSHASLYSQTTGKHQFKVAPSGSADGTPTLTTGLEIDNSGRVTTPNQPAFLANATTGQTLSTNWQDVGYNNLIGSQRGGTNYNTTTSKFTAPVSGWYQFNASWTATTNADQDGTFFLSINNSTFNSAGSVSIPTTSPHYDGHVISGCCYLAANDTMHVKRYATVSTTTRTHYVYGGYFSGFLIG